MGLCVGGQRMRMVWTVERPGTVEAGKPRAGFCGNGGGSWVARMESFGNRPRGGRRKGERRYRRGRGTPKVRISPWGSTWVVHLDVGEAPGLPCPIGD